MIGLFQMTGAVVANAGMVLLGAVIALVVGGLVVSWVLARRREHREVRAIVHGLEEIRTGRPRGRPEVGADSSLAVVADAVHRLGHDLHTRWSDAESAAERWRALTAATQDTAIITTDTDGDVRSFSAGASALFGFEEDEILSQPVSVIFEESAYKDLLPALARRSVRQHGFTARSRLQRQDGSDFPAEVTVRSLIGNASQPVGFMMVVRDLTAQQQLEDGLRESERRYRGLVEGLAEGVLILRRGHIVYVNAAAAQLLGARENELERALWREHVATDDVLVVDEAIDAVELTGSPREEIRCALSGVSGGRGAEVRLVASPVELDGEAAVLLLVQDETAERMIAAELRRNEARLDAVIEAASDGILVLSDDPSGNQVQMTNRAFSELVNQPVEELLGNSMTLVTRRLRRAGAGGQQLADAIAGELPSTTRVTMDVAGAEREIEVNVTALGSSRSEVLGRIVACRDISEFQATRRQLEDQAAQLEDGKRELEQSYRRLNDVNMRLEGRSEELDRLNQELRRLDEMKSNLLGNVSHELQTPLVSIRGYTEMILKERLGPINEEQRKGLGLSLKNIDRMIAMIDNLLAFTRTDPDARDLDLTRFPLGPLIREAVELLREKMQDKRLELQLELGDRALDVRADRDKILQVLLNLVSNAVKFTPAGGAIAVNAMDGPSGYVSVSVGDNGIGIPEEDQGRIFERHFQVTPAPGGDRSGSGIGLTIVREILRLHGCTIQVQSEPGRGTEFTFTLPAAASESQRLVPRRTVAPRAAPPGESQPDPEPAPQPAPERGSSDRPRPRLRIIRRDRQDG